MKRRHAFWGRVVLIPAMLFLVAPTVGSESRLLADDCPDYWITVKVKALLVAEDGLSAFKIDVDTRVCVVKLYGCVETRAQKKRATEIARSVKKVQAVKNLLKICPKEE